MERITLKNYAVKHKISMFDVMKLVKNGKVKSEVFYEKGREVTYILLEDEGMENVSASKPTVRQGNEKRSLEEEIENLKNELALLRHDLEALKKMRI